MRIPSMDKLRTPILVLVALLVGIGIGISWPNAGKTVLKTTGLQSPSPSPDFSYYENLLKENHDVWIKKPNPVDLNGDNKPEVIYITSGEGCASCHEQIIRIFDGQKEIFNKMSDDPLFVPGNKAFMVFQPVRKEGKPLCCPTSFSLLTYIWNGQTFEEQK